MNYIHDFHIPVMGLSFSVDTPLKVAHYGISSVVSIMEEDLLEMMREHHSKKNGIPFEPVDKKEFDSRAKRITAYCNLLDVLVKQNIEKLRQQDFTFGSEIVKYFELLPEQSPVKAKYREMLLCTDQEERSTLEAELRKAIVPGYIDVNIMSKVDNLGATKTGEPLPVEQSDALTALRGYAQSVLNSSIVFSAGYNPRLYNYIAAFEDFYPNECGMLKKRVILKVSDYRSAVVQGKILAKKGIWVSEFRIESGLNCGGHAFATDGLLCGPILQSFKENRHAMREELFTLCNTSLQAAGRNIFPDLPMQRITYQGGIGTAHEQQFLIDFYELDGTGWGSPFLLVPEATNVDDATLNALATAEPDDYYLSGASPLGIPFNHFRKSGSQKLRDDRVAAGKPGNPCVKKLLISNTEYTQEPICTSSIKYQRLKLDELKKAGLSEEEYNKKFSAIVEKDCLCTGLGTTALLKNDIVNKQHKPEGVIICPGPNLAYFSGTFSLSQMIDHIYGRTNVRNAVERASLFVNELVLYVKYLRKEIDRNALTLNQNTFRTLNAFKTNLLAGIEYYKGINADFLQNCTYECPDMIEALDRYAKEIEAIEIPSLVIAS
ncbi:MAG: hypothetical protein EBU66_08835 [Bacteroidetes bacterium]|nr:hypothetical protein [bacterium]NBP64749.1 hypothetical protein [Bacteroidota bacterium]